MTDSIQLTFNVAEVNRLIGTLGEKARRLEDAGRDGAAIEYRALRDRIIDEANADDEPNDNDVPAECYVGLEARLGQAGYGCPDPDDVSGDWLSDGYDTAADALRAAAIARNITGTEAGCPLHVAWERAHEAVYPL